jgi:hypothetical protein
MGNTTGGAIEDATGFNPWDWLTGEGNDPGEEAPFNKALEGLGSFLDRLSRFPGKVVGTTSGTLRDIVYELAGFARFFTVRLMNGLVQIGGGFGAFIAQIWIGLYDLIFLFLLFWMVYIVHKDDFVQDIINSITATIMTLIQTIGQIVSTGTQAGARVGSEAVKGLSSTASQGLSSAAEAGKGITSAAGDISKTGLQETGKTLRGGFGGSSGQGIAGRNHSADDFRAYRSSIESASSSDRLNNLRSSLQKAKANDKDAEAARQDMLSLVDSKLQKVGQGRDTRESVEGSDRFSAFDKKYFENMRTIDELLDAAATLSSIEPENEKEAVSKRKALVMLQSANVRISRKFVAQVNEANKAMREFYKKASDEDDVSGNVVTDGLRRNPDKMEQLGDSEKVQALLDRMDSAGSTWDDYRGEFEEDPLNLVSGRDAPELLQSDEIVNKAENMLIYAEELQDIGKTAQEFGSSSAQKVADKAKSVLQTVGKGAWDALRNFASSTGSAIQRISSSSASGVRSAGQSAQAGFNRIGASRGRYTRLGDFGAQETELQDVPEQQGLLQGEGQDDDLEDISIEEN